MPLPVEKLTPNSSADAISAAISASIKKLMEEGKSQEEAAGQAYEMARDRTGKSLGRRG